MIDQLVKKLKKTKKRVFIQTHDFPDPDAVATAFGLQAYLKTFQILSEIVFCGEIQRDALKKMITMLNINIHNFNDTDISPNDLIIIVDGCKWSKNVTDLPGFEIAVIDHHIVKEPDDVPFIEIHQTIGACATIITTYFMNKNLDISLDVATALKIGISRDTDLLTRKVTQKDIDAFHYLYSYAQNDTVDSLLRNNIQLSDFDFFNNTISNLKRNKSVAWHYFENGCETNLMGILGDFILSAQEINLSILFAKNSDKISISIRNENPKWNAAETIRCITNKIGAGGGHKQMAGGIIFSSKDFSPEEVINKVYRSLI